MLTIYFWPYTITILGANSQPSEDRLEDVDTLSIADSMLFGHSKALESCIASMNSFVEAPDAFNDKVIQGIDKNSCSANDVLRLLDITKRNINAERENGGDQKLCKNLMAIVHRAIPLAKDFLAASQKGKVENIPKLEKRLESISNEISKINIQLTAREKVPISHKRGPGMLEQAKSMFGGGKKSLVENGLQQAHLKLEVTRAQLKSTQEEADRALERQLEVNKRLQEKLMQIAKFEAEGKTHAEIMEVLQQGLKAFGELKEQWTKLLLFFQSMSNLINTSLGPPLKGFIDHANMINSERQQGFEPSEFCRELIYQPAKEAVKVRHFNLQL